MPAEKQPAAGPKGDVIGRNARLRGSTIAAYPGLGPENEKAEHPSVQINGVTYTWTPGETDGIPEEALAIWARYLEANT